MCVSQTAKWKAISGFSMVMSLLIAILSAISIAVYECHLTDLTTYKPTNEYLIYIAYFFNAKCLNVDSNLTVTDYVVLNDEPAYRTWCWSVGYLTLNILWFLSSLLLHAALKRLNDKKGIYLSLPWAWMTFVVLIVDIAACIIYANNDYDKFQTLDSFVLNMGLVKLNGSLMYPTDYTPLMLSVVLIFFSKAVILWIATLYCFIVITNILRKIAKPRVPIIDYSRQPVPSAPNIPTDAFHINESHPIQWTSSHTNANINGTPSEPVINLNNWEESMRTMDEEIWRRTNIEHQRAMGRQITYY